MGIREIDIKQDEGQVAKIIMENLDVAMAIRKSRNRDRVCPGIAKVGIFVEGS